ncbi:nucleotide-binding domain-containing protein [Aeromonas veronii]|uniref:nucleotide-binding domain-containing protein n=1 Tax=Aeromonas veronii TaxID=654 RepID=UPI003BA13AC4
MFDIVNDLYVLIFRGRMGKINLDSITKEYFSDLEGNYSFGMESIAGNESIRNVNESIELFKNGRVRIYGDTLKSLVKPKEFTYQNILRPYFNKSGINFSKIGSHPDFADLKNSGDIENHHIVTMFVDIKRSSRLSLLMPLEKAYLVKNRILQACVDVIRALDGYPHRLMGDAVMAFFGDKKTSSEDAIANALNAAASLKLILTKSVFPELNRILGKDVNLGVRIGMDYGNDDEVIWANYGYGDASEVTALGLPVDLASKAQSQAKTNTAMMGQGILEHIDFPELYSEIKKVIQNGVEKEELYILPNMMDAVGKPINRRCRLLNMDMYQAVLPIPTDWKNGINSVIPHPNVIFTCYYKMESDSSFCEYRSASSFLEKDVALKFEVQISNPRELEVFYPLKVVFKKTNHGKEAREKNSEGSYEIERKIDYNNSQYQNQLVLDIPEATAYRGLHTMEVILYPNKSNVILYKNIIAVFIK